MTPHKPTLAQRYAARALAGPCPWVVRCETRSGVRWLDVNSRKIRYASCAYRFHWRFMADAAAAQGKGRSVQTLADAIDEHAGRVLPEET